MYYAVTRNNHGAFGYVPRGREVGFGIRDVQCGGILSVGWKKLWEKGGVGCSRNSFVSKICVWGGGGVEYMANVSSSRVFKDLKHCAIIRILSIYRALKNMCYKL